MTHHAIYWENARITSKRHRCLNRLTAVCVSTDLASPAVSQTAVCFKGLKVSLCLNKHNVARMEVQLHAYLTSGVKCVVSSTSRPLYLWEIVVSEGWELTINEFPPGEVLRNCRAEAMSVVIGVVSCTAVEKKQQNVLCWLSRGTERSSLLVFQFESAVSGLGNK